MTRQGKYYYRQSKQSRAAKTRVTSTGRLLDALSSGEPGPGVQQRTVTLIQVVSVAALALAQLFDYGTFVLLVQRHGLAAEANPIVVHIAQTAGLLGLTVAKVGTVVFALALVLLILPRRPKLAMVLLAFGVAAGLVGGISNVASF